ncbi:FISUMP domain-containing protein [Elizabethkingia bruuniana]|uniref:FISUMP domain-containing protein n=1 Tax=Elizabethkingia bruuniana TaxID=1756149 RepID=UPI0013F60507|nr:FISUMP domain-containing protein [Elizabethkingia bruuniana]
MKTKVFKSLMVSILLSVLSCRSTDTENNIADKMAIIKFNIQGSSFEDNVDIGTQANLNEKGLGNIVERQEIPFSDDLNLIAELIPNIGVTAGSAQASLNPSGAIQQTPIKRAIKYRVVVYNNDGTYNTSSIYSVSASGISTPDSGENLKLNGGSTYTFVIYSYNTNTAPNENLTGTTLTTPLSISGSADFMYYKTTLTPTGDGNGENYLDVVLKHKFSLITVILDATLTNGYNISNIGSSTLSSHNTTASINFSTGVITPTGTSGNVTPNFSTVLPSNMVTSTPLLLNADIDNGTFSLSSITIGPTVKSTPTLLTGLSIKSGIMYNLVLKFTPTDTYIDNYNNTGYNAVRIQGRVWMRHNLGANTSFSPDVPVQGIAGSYFQWGKNVVAATSSSPSVVFPWNTTIAPNGSWNSGTETNPVKNTTNDPCPVGWRLPTQTEWNTLISNTTQLSADNIGSNWTQNNSNFGNAKVFRSKRDYNVKLTLPAVGNYNNTGALANRAVAGAYWASTDVNNTTSARLIVNVNGASTGSGSNNRIYAANVRCIAQ